MYCKKCGAMIPNGQLKCEKCGWEAPKNRQETVISSIEEQALTVSEQKHSEKAKQSGVYGVTWQLHPCAVGLLHSIKVLIRCSGMIPVIPTLINM